MRRSNTSRRTNRTLVPRCSAACSTDSSVSNSGGLPLACGGSCSGSGCGGQLLPGDATVFAGTSGCREGQPPLPLGRIARAHVDPGGNDDDGLVVALGSAPSVQGHAVLGAAALGEGDPGPPQHGHGGGVAAAL